jgi:hypothetical protein
MFSSWIVKSLKLTGISNKIHYENHELLGNKNAPTHRKKIIKPKLQKCNVGCFKDTWHHYCYLVLVNPLHRTAVQFENRIRGTHNEEKDFTLTLHGLLMCKTEEEFQRDRQSTYNVILGSVLLTVVAMKNR